MKLVGTGLGDDVDDRSGVAAVLGVEGVGEDAEFGDAVGAGLDRWQVSEQIVGVAPVHVEVVRPATAAVHRNYARLIAAIGDGVTATDVRHDARLQLQQLIGVASVEGQLRRHEGIDGGAELGGTGVNQRSFRADLDGFGGRTKRQGAVDGERLVQVEGYLLARELLETGSLEFDGVSTDGDRREPIITVLVRLSVIADASGVVGDGHRGVRDHSAAGIGNPPSDSSTSALSRRCDPQQRR